MNRSLAFLLAGLVLLAFSASLTSAQPVMVRQPVQFVDLAGVDADDEADGTTFTLGVADLSPNVYFTNRGSTEEIVIALPPCLATSVGAVVNVLVIADEDVDVDPTSADTIVFGALTAGDPLELRGVGESVTLACAVATEWVVLRGFGASFVVPFEDNTHSHDE